MHEKAAIYSAIASTIYGTKTLNAKASNLNMLADSLRKDTAILKKMQYGIMFQMERPFILRIPSYSTRLLSH